MADEGVSAGPPSVGAEIGLASSSQPLPADLEGGGDDKGQRGGQQQGGRGRGRGRGRGGHHGGGGRGRGGQMLAEDHPISQMNVKLDTISQTLKEILEALKANNNAEGGASTAALQPSTTPDRAAGSEERAAGSEEKADAA